MKIKMSPLRQAVTTLVIAWSLGACATRPIEQRVKHGFIQNGDVKIHYVELGKGPLIVMLHGFPDFWYGWRAQMDALAEDYKVVALDMRGYNLSDKPLGAGHYTLEALADDVESVIRQESPAKAGPPRAAVMGHDWGGSVAWHFAKTRPEMTDRLIVLNSPHPRALNRELVNNPDQRERMQYSQNFRKPESHAGVTSEQLANWVIDPEAKQRYIAAFDRSDVQAMMHYYRANFPPEPYTPDPSPAVKLRMPVLIIQSLEDRVLAPQTLNDSWELMERDLTIVTIPGARHFVQQDAAEMVNRTINSWLSR